MMNDPFTPAAAIGCAGNSAFQQETTMLNPDPPHANRRRKAAIEAGASGASVTVIMPIRNESGFIDKSLGAVLAQDYPKHLMEVIVADGMSTDDTRERIARLRMSHPEIAVHIVDNPGMIVPTGFNLA